MAQKKKKRKVKRRHPADKPSLNPLAVICPLPRQICIDLVIIPTNVLRIPPVAPISALRERRLRPLQRHITTAHDALPQVVKAMRKVPRSFLAKALGFSGLEGGVGFDDGVLYN